jgi:hypothetical protein
LRSLCLVNLGLAEEDYGYLFVDMVPLLYDKKKVERQLKVETWLDLYQLTRELGIAKVERVSGSESGLNYVI